MEKKSICISIETETLERLDALIKKHHLPNRSYIISSAVFDRVDMLETELEDREVG